MYKFYTIFKRDLVNIFLSPVLMFYNTLFPFLLILILGFLSSNNYGKGILDSYDYYGITMLLFIVLNVSVTAANSFMEKSLKESNLRIIYSPIKPSFIYLSKIAATFVFTSLSFMVIMLVSNLALGVNFGGGRAVYIVTLILLFDLLCACLGVFFCCVFKSEELSNKILSLVNNIFAVLGGLFFQLDGFGNTAHKLTYISPVKWLLEGIFKIIYDKDLSCFVPVSFSFAALSLILILGCKLTFRTEDYI
ncbi:MAG: ABC transporter permease [Bacillota bacterium]|nr:ABC transporter permease [Bacillota bacterium]